MVCYGIFWSGQLAVGSPEGKHFKNVSNLSPATTQTIVIFVVKLKMHVVNIVRGFLKGL